MCEDVHGSDCLLYLVDVYTLGTQVVLVSGL